MEHTHAWRSHGPRRPLRCIVCEEVLTLTPTQKQVVETAIRHPEHMVFAQWRTKSVLIAKDVAYSLAGSEGSTGSTSFSNATYLYDTIVEHYGLDRR